jgi:tetratricopeptide (TPR) repeat protein
VSEPDGPTDLDNRIKRSQIPKDDIEAQNLRAQVEQRLFGGAVQPARIGRYDILHRVGSGGLGVIYAAHDAELDRRVAIKVLQPEAGQSSATGEAHARLVREAQAMAQLSHPNVIHVYEVGSFGDEVYIAMELVDGDTMAEWMRAPGRTWREVLEHFIYAGRGLAAAHDAGLVHRDFKPTNVLVDREGRVRVLDFGLAKLAGAPSVEHRGPAGSASGRGLGAVLTEMGSLVGTPAYMSPEQHAGSEAAEADPSSDQYSFCVALWEGLYGRRPFAGRNLEELLDNKSSQTFDIGESTAERAVPQWVRAILARGLRVAPADRFASMHDLLAALGHDPVRARRRRIGLVAGVVAIAGMIFAGFSMGRAGGDRCDGIADQLGVIWSEDTKRKIERAFTDSGKAYAPDLWARVATELDAYTAKWLQQRTNTCEKMREATTSALLDRQLCLDHRLRDVAELAGLLSRGDADVIEHAAEAVSALPELDPCDEAEGLAEGLAADAEARKRIAEIEATLTRGRALRAAGRFDDALKLARGVREETKRLGYVRGTVEAALLEGSVLDDQGELEQAETVLSGALQHAEQLGMDAAATRILIQLVWAVGINGGRHDEGERLARLAEAKLARSGNPPRLEASLRNTLGTMLQKMGDYEGARKALERALELRRSGEDALRLASTINNLGVLNLSTDDFAQAADYFDQALSLYEEEVGATHPLIAKPLGNLGAALLQLKRAADAQVHLERALTIAERELGEEHPSVARLLVNLGLCHLEQNDAAGALARFERALKVGERALGENHPLLATVRVNIANAQRELGGLDEALATGERALADFARLLGKEHPQITHAHASLAATLVERGDPEAAREHLLRAVALREKALGPDNRAVAELLVDLGDVDLKTGRPGQAAARLERALDILSENDPADRKLVERARPLLMRAREG